MTITLGSETQKLLEEQMKRSGVTSPEDVIRMALERLSIEAFNYNDLDDATQAAIERGQAECDRGEGVTAPEAFTALKRELFRR